MLSSGKSNRMLSSIVKSWFYLLKLLQSIYPTIKETICFAPVCSFLGFIYEFHFFWIAMTYLENLRATTQIMLTYRFLHSVRWKKCRLRYQPRQAQPGGVRRLVICCGTCRRLGNWVKGEVHKEVGEDEEANDGRDEPDPLVLLLGNGSHVRSAHNE